MKAGDDSRITPTIIPLSLLRRNRSSVTTTNQQQHQLHSVNNSKAQSFTESYTPQPQHTFARSSIPSSAASAPPPSPPFPTRAVIASADPYRNDRICISVVRMTVWAAILACATITALDLYTKASEKNGGVSIFLQILVVGSYTLLALASIVFTISRWITVRSALSRLPKLYIPISEKDGIPTHVHAHIHLCLSKSSTVIDQIKPEVHEDTLSEWGMPGTPLEGVHFRSATLKSVRVLRDNTTYTGTFVLRKVLRVLVDQGRADRRVAKLYAESVESARWDSGTVVTVDQYLLSMKLLALLIHSAASGSGTTAPPSIN